MKLTCNEPRVIFELNNFYKVFLGSTPDMIRPASLRISLIEAAVRPLPKEDITPPVIKIYFVMKYP
jgi:hypothetical protein